MQDFGLVSEGYGKCGKWSVPTEKLFRALNGSKSRVIHIEDLSQNGVYDEEFPADT